MESGDLGYVIIHLIGVIGFFVAAFVFAFKYGRRRSRIKKWAKRNHLQYKKNADLPFFRLDSSVLRDVVWGKYQGENMYFFNIFFGSNDRLNSSFLNGVCYQFLTLEEIKEILDGKNAHKEKRMDVMYENLHQSGIRTQILVALFFLKHSMNVNYRDVNTVFGAMDDISKHMAKHVNDPAVIAKLQSDLSGKVDEKIIQELPDIYQEALDQSI